MCAQLVNEINARTRFCAVFGQPVRHSASPAMHNAAFAALRLNCRYLACEVDPTHLRAAIEGAMRMGFLGLNLTVPHKIVALDFVDILDEDARRWGAINTIVFEGSDDGETWKPPLQWETAPKRIRSRGFNTDVDAVAQSIRRDLQVEIRGAKILLLGAGGAGRAAALKLASEGAAELHLVNRTLSKAEDLLVEIRRDFPAVRCSLGYPSGRIDILVNATSLGLTARDPLPLDLDRFPLQNAGHVFDMIYRPARTPLLARAEQCGSVAANGLGMLLYQGAAAFRLWTGHEPPIPVMRQALNQEIYG